MTRRRNVVKQLHNLVDIREIMSAMRNLALLETYKLLRAVRHQEQVVTTIRQTIRDVLAFFPHLLTETANADELYVVLGSERGFCGDFNRALLAELPAAGTGPGCPIVTVGQRLAWRLPDGLEPFAILGGATTTEEVPEVLVRLMRTLDKWRGSGTARRPQCPLVVYHDTEGIVKVTSLDPTAGVQLNGQLAGYPPRTNLPPEILFEKLADHYLYAVLYQIFYGSLLAENERRLRHMENASKRIDDRCAALRRRRNALWQEEITEEIEVITLSAGLTESDLAGDDFSGPVSDDSRD
jgi:F-type H+-transporting ATPase subunit gamma